jgi:hypothetical protein
MLQLSWSPRALWAGAWTILIFPAFAWALETVQVGPSGAIVFSNPQANSSMTGTLRPGQSVRIVETPTAGYYRVAVGRKYVGWVQESALNMPRSSTPEAPTQAATTVKAAAPEPRREPPKSYLGAFGGLGVAGGTSFGFGFDGGYKLSQFWGLGMYFEYLRLASASGAANTSGSNSNGGSTSAAANASGAAAMILASIELNYYILRVPGLYVGAKAGLGMAAANTTSDPTSTTSSSSSNTGVGAPAGQAAPNTFSFALGGGVAAGYDYPVWQQQLTVGAESNVFFLTGDLATTIFNVMGSVKYVF